MCQLENIRLSTWQVVFRNQFHNVLQVHNLHTLDQPLSRFISTGNFPANLAGSWPIWPIWARSEPMVNQVYRILNSNSKNQCLYGTGKNTGADCQERNISHFVKIKIKDLIKNISCEFKIWSFLFSLNKRWAYFSKIIPWVCSKNGTRLIWQGTQGNRNEFISIFHIQNPIQT